MATWEKQVRGQGMSWTHVQSATKTHLHGTDASLRFSPLKLVLPTPHSPSTIYTMGKEVVMWIMCVSLVGCESQTYAYCSHSWETTLDPRHPWYIAGRERPHDWEVWRSHKRHLQPGSLTKDQHYQHIIRRAHTTHGHLCPCKPGANRCKSSAKQVQAWPPNCKWSMKSMKSASGVKGILHIVKVTIVRWNDTNIMYILTCVTVRNKKIAPLSRTYSIDVAEHEAESLQNDPTALTEPRLRQE